MWVYLSKPENSDVKLNIYVTTTQSALLHDKQAAQNHNKQSARTARIQSGGWSQVRAEYVQYFLVIRGIEHLKVGFCGEVMNSYTLTCCGWPE